MAERRRRIRKLPIILFAAVILGGVVVVTKLGFAKMASEPVDYSKSMPVAEWSIVATGSEDDMNLLAGGATRNYVLAVTNSSDVACTYVVTISNVPEGVSVGLGNSAMAAPNNEGKIIFNGADNELNAHASDNRTLKFAASLDAGPISDNEIEIDVEFIQKEPE
jgi:hypothetical protein